LGLAVNWPVAPTPIDVLGALTEIEVSTDAAVTVIVIGADTMVAPDVAVAVIVAVPAATPVTSPDALTVATPVALDPYVTVAAIPAPF
jgi:hypothetical protein